MRQLHQPIEPKDDFVPALSLRRRMDYFIDKLHLTSPQQGSDDLDSYEAYLVETNGNRFLLLRYAGYPTDMVDVFVPARLVNKTRLLNKIVSELEVPDDAVTHHSR